MGILDGNKRVASMTELAPLIIESIQHQSDVKITVKGNSMFPLFKSERDCVRLTACDRVRKYDIVLYRRENGQYVLHRVVKIEGGKYGISGDNEEFIEYPVDRAQIIAVASGFWRKGRYCSCRNVLYNLYARLWLLLLHRRHSAVRCMLKVRRALHGK